MSSDKLEVYTKGTKAWFKDAQEGYVVATMVEKAVQDKKLIMKFTIDATNKEEKFEQLISKLEANNYDDLPALKNPPRLEGADDLTNLSYLHEAAVLHSVRIRYLQEIIYTYSGLVLIAMNPFRRMNIYTAEIMRQYAGRPRHELEPHLFAIAEEAYRKMINEKVNQSIIVSGESGAGKTQSAKYVMRYFATVDELSTSRAGSATDIANSSTSIEDAVLSTNPIMEAFGNSKTTRNDNSSRFGKYIEILFEKKPHDPASVTIVGARIRTYLLERSRLTFQPDSERNYHIFYQLCAAAPAAERAELGIGAWDSFFYLNQGKTGTVNGVDDAEEFAITQKGMSVVGISVSTQWDIFKICAALLHIGNIKITDSRGAAQIDENDHALGIASKLLGVDPAEFRKWLIKKQITTRSEKIISDANTYQAITSRDSIAKYIYSLLFDWIVKIVNTKLDTVQTSKEGRFIGVLDIYGFEHFQKNSFEQFCINYANEKLQQEFTRHVFKLEQEEYVAEQISWSFIDFSDNQPCIDMIENKLGILDLLDEESRLPSGADDSLITKLYQRFGTAEHKFFEKPRFGQKEFVIKHYALDVSYQIEGFIEKNKDTVSEEQLKMLNDSSFEFLREVIYIEPEPEKTSPQPPRGRAGGNKKPTLGSIFKNSLIKLMDTLRQTNPHYIRCIKPNQAKVAFEFEAHNVLGQLVACGVLETIKISRAGYPSKQTFSEFASRYYFLVPSSQWKTDPKVLTEKIVKSVIKGDNKYELGLRKVFFRAGQLAYLEKIRSEKFTAIVTFIQKCSIRTLRQRKYQQMKKSAITIQTAYRGFAARKFYKSMQQEAAAIKIQTCIRGALARKKYKKIRSSARKIQKTWRRYVHKREFFKNRGEKSALRIQKVWRGYKARKLYKKEIRKIVLVQSLYRRKKAIRDFKALKIEARSVGKLKETNYKLESKVFELSQSLDAKKKENVEVSKHLASLEEQLASLREKYQKMETDSKAKGSGAQEETAELRKQLASAVESRDMLVKETEKLHGMIRKRDDSINHLQTEVANSQAEIKRMKEDLKNAPKQEDTATVNALKKEVASLREQMGRLVAGKYRTDRITEKFLNNDYAAANPLPTPAPVHTSAAARMSMSFFESAAQVTARVAESLGRGSSDSLAPEPKRKIQEIVIEDDTEQKDRPIRMLEARDLEDEVIDSLITNLRIPLPSTQTVATRKEIFFPAHLIGYLLSELLEHKMIDRMRDLLNHIMRAIQQLTMKFEDDYVSAFWLSNNYELMSIIKTARLRLPRPSLPNQDDEQSASAVLQTVHVDLKKVMLEIYHGWIKEFKKRLANMIVPAVIENQSLPGYICKQSGGIWSQWAAKSAATSQFSIDQLLNFLSKLSKTMRCYYMEESMSRQILTELLRVIGVSAFNHLLMRKNFCTWKRGVQIQYNVSRLEEWCTGHGIAEATLHLQQLMQAAKLLTLNKTSASDIEMIFDVCFLLNPTQIKKLLSLYYAADFDSPLSTDLLKIVSNRAAVNEKLDSLLLDLDSSPEFIYPEPRNVKHIEKFIPAWIDLPYIQAVLSASYGSSSAVEATPPQ
ncbi:Myosin type-2 heavy chain 1 [Terramyces sp. JEL0728]|nr:Myosin type-2 heavy chain 1 [Terramyces sp. JEL0728]